MFRNVPNPNMIPFGMPNMGMFNNFNPQINSGGSQNQNLLQVYNNRVNNNPQQSNNSQLFGEKFNILFKTTGGLRTQLVFERGTPICDILCLYCKRVQKPELYADNSGIFFLYNARKINIHDKTKVENFLNISISPIIMVNDVQNLIGA